MNQVSGTGSEEGMLKFLKVVKLEQRLDRGERASRYTWGKGILPERIETHRLQVRNRLGVCDEP